MAKNNNTKGFSGLSDLVSKIELEDEEAPSKIFNTRSDKIQSEESMDNETVSQVSRNEKGGAWEVEGKMKSGDRKKWVLAFIAIVSLIWLANYTGEKTADKKYTKPQAGQYQSIDGTTDSKSSNIKKDKKTLRYEKPPIGKNNILIVPQIRWCVREGIRIEKMRDIVISSQMADEFNRIVNEYNSRCGSYKYRAGSLEIARREVWAGKSEIEANAVRYIQKYNRSQSSMKDTISNEKVVTDTKKLPSPYLTLEAQKLLLSLGYDPGPMDGMYGRRTSDAIKMYQKDEGLEENGRVNEKLIEALMTTKTRKKDSINIAIPSNTSISIIPKISKDNDFVKPVYESHFTRGSHKDDVLRLQGTPSSINQYTGYEIWYYGISSVQIALPDRRVTEWNNAGNNLKVE